MVRDVRLAEAWPAGGFADVTFYFAFPPPTNASVALIPAVAPADAALAADIMLPSLRIALVRATSPATTLASNRLLIFGPGETSVTLRLGYAPDGVATGAAFYPLMNISAAFARGGGAATIIWPTLRVVVADADVIALSINVAGAAAAAPATLMPRMYLAENAASGAAATRGLASTGVLRIALASAPVSLAPASLSGVALSTGVPVVSVMLSLPSALCAGPLGVRAATVLPCASASDCPTGSACLDAPALALNATVLYFGATNWSIPQGVALMLADNAIDDTGPGSKVYATMVSLAVAPAGGAQAAWLAAAASVLVMMLDDDATGVAVAGGGVAIAGGSMTYMLSLTSQPRGDVTLLPRLSADSTGTAFLSPSDAGSLRRGPASWQTPMNVTVQVLSSATVNTTITLGHSVASAADLLYTTTIAPSYRARVSSDVAPGILTQFIPTSVDGEARIPTGGAGYRLLCATLTSAPLATVSLRIMTAAIDASSNSSAPLQALTPSPEALASGSIFAPTAPSGYSLALLAALRSTATLTFTPATWRAARCVGLAPTLPAGSWLTLSATPSSPDGAYAAQPPMQGAGDATPAQLIFTTPGARVLAATEGGTPVVLTVASVGGGAGLRAVRVVPSTGVCSLRGTLQLGLPCATSDDCVRGYAGNGAAVCVQGLGVNASVTTVDLSNAGTPVVINVWARLDGVPEGGLHPAQVKVRRQGAQRHEGAVSNAPRTPPLHPPHPRTSPSPIVPQPPPTQFYAGDVYLGGMPILVTDIDGAGLAVRVLSPAAAQNGTLTAAFSVSLRSRPASSVTVVPIYAPALLAPNGACTRACV